MKQESNKLTTREKDYSQWYLDVVQAASLAEHSEVKGAMIIKPYGYSIWERMQAILDAEIKATGHENAYFPLLIPESYLSREKSHVEGFSPELAVVTHAGGEKLAEPLVVRPTSETIIYATYAKWIQSWRDLPLLINQWANVVRWELRPRLFLRTTEFLWQEGHTAHTTESEAEAEVLKMLAVYKRFAEDILAVAVIDGQKTEAERFAGALRTYCIEAMMQDGKALQMGTSHNLGQNFAKVFNVQFLDKENKQQYVWQTSWGVSTRLIGGLIMAHSDDKGLVLPPRIAPVQVVILPIWKTDADKESVLHAANDLVHMCGEQGIRVRVDASDDTVGARHFAWEKKGVPVRVEIGPRDVAKNALMFARRDTEGKTEMQMDMFASSVREMLENMQIQMLQKSCARMLEKTVPMDSYDEFKTAIENNGFFSVHWCGNAACEAKVKQETKATIRCIPFAAPAEDGVCLVCREKSTKRVILAKAY